MYPQVYVTPMSNSTMRNFEFLDQIFEAHARRAFGFDNSCHMEALFLTRSVGLGTMDILR